MIKKPYQKEVIKLDGRRQHVKFSQLKFRNVTTLDLMKCGFNLTNRNGVPVRQ